MSAAPHLHFAVHGDLAVGDHGFRIGTGIDEAGEFEELPEPDYLVPDRDVGGFARVCHGPTLSGTP